MSACPNCGCPFVSVYAEETADMPRAWQDEDGTWYKGGFSRNEKRRCDNCGRTETRAYRWGKLESSNIIYEGDPRR